MDDRYGTGQKGLNTTGGSNRFKFQGKQARAKRVDVDVAHKVRAEGFLDADKAQDPEVEGGSFFQQELDRSKELNVTPPFKRFYYKVWPLVQSLPELLHHSPTVVDMLLALLENPVVVTQAGEETLQLISVLGRDLQSSFFPHFPRVSTALMGLVASPDVAPEICGRVLRCLGFLLKFIARPLSKDMASVRALYAPLLGHKRDFARKMAAQSLAPAVRRLKPKAMRRHVKQLVDALAAGSVAAATAASGTDGQGDTPGGARLRADTLDGCSQLLFFSAKGVHGRTHSQAPVLLRALLDSLLPPKVADGNAASKEAGAATAAGERGLHERRRKQLERGWCFELASAVLALLVEHVRSPHSTELWLELHYGLGTATARHRSSLAKALSGISGDGGSGGLEESAECAAVRHTADLLSQAVGHMGGILLREEAVGVKQAALLAEVLAELTSPDLFWQAGTSSGCRRAVVELLAVSLCGLHKQQRLVKVMPTVIRAAAAAPLIEGGKNGDSDTTTLSAIDNHPALALSRSLLGGVGAERTENKPPPMRVTRAVALRPLLEACAGPLSGQADVALEILVRVIHGTGIGLVFTGDKVSNIAGAGAQGGAMHDGSDDGSEAGIEEDEEGGMRALASVAGAEGPSCLPIGLAEGKKLLDVCCTSLELATASLKRDPSSSPVVVARALAAFRCLPCLVGSFAATQDARREAVGRPLGLTEELLAACSTPDDAGTATKERPATVNNPAGGESERGRKRSRSKGGKATAAVKDADGGGGEEGVGGGETEGGGGDLVVLRAHALEAAVGLCSLLPPDDESESGVAGREETLGRLLRWHERAKAWLRAGPASISTLRAVALLLRAIRAAAASSGSATTPSCLSSDACIPMMTLLEPNLASESRLLRLSTMRVLVRYDPQCFEEEHGGGGGGSHRGRGHGQDDCNFLEVAEAVEALPISVASERDLMWRLGQLEVMGRSGRLPRPYARLMATHALGLLRVKFSGVWPRAAAIIAALYKQANQREVVWEPVQSALRKVMPPPATRPEVAAVVAQDERRPAPGAADEPDEEGAVVVAPSVEGPKISDNADAELNVSMEHILQQQQQQSSGLRVTVPPPQPWVPRLLSHAAALDGGPTEEMDLPVALQGIFRDESVRKGLQPDSGEVPLWASTDADSAFAQVWGVLSQCPELLQQHSRTVVPLFLGFMQYQYLGNKAFPDDPETRAVGIFSHLTSSERASAGPGGWGPVVRRGGGGSGSNESAESVGRTADRRSVRARLVALLGVFASASGPKSLYKQRVLFRVYRALVVMPDDKVAGLALRCILSYRPPYLVPYKANLEGLMNDDTFRNELVTFSLETGAAGGSGGGATSHPLSTSSGTTAADAGPVVDPLHRPRLLPMVIRLVYGRLAASGSRGRAGGHGGPAARRAAVLGFLSGLSSDELAELFALMVRPFLPLATTPSSSSEGLDTGGGVERDEGPADWDDAAGGAVQAREVLDRAAAITSTHLGGVPASRQAGFLKMAKEVAKQLGQKALPYVERLLGLVLVLLEHSNTVSEAERRARVKTSRSRGEGVGNDVEEMDEVDNEDDADEEFDDAGVLAVSSSVAAGKDKVSLRGKIAPGALRALCLRALSELFSQFSTSFDFTAFEGTLWAALADPIARLPASTIGATRKPALLALAETLTESEALLPMFSSTTGKGGEAFVPAVLDCISAGSGSGRVAGPAVVGSALTFVERLLRYDGGSLLTPHLNHLISNFAARLSVNGTSRNGEGGGGGGGLDSHTEQGLIILARVAEMATSGPLGAAGGGGGAVNASSMSQLVALLMPSLQPDRRASDEAKSSILRTVAALALRVDSSGARKAWPALSRLLGPAGARPSGMAAAAPRGELVRALEALASRPDLAASAGPAVSLVTELNARDAMALDEPDFGRAVPAYNSLSEGTGWEDVVAAGGEATLEGDLGAPLGGALAATPVAQHCFHAMHDQEVALRGAAGAALKRLVREVAVRERASTAAGVKRCAWEGLMRTVLMPGLRAGMACRVETVRKGYISLLREAVSVYQAAAGDGADGGDSSSTKQAEQVGSASVVPTDLWILARADDPESDFFLNACHMQVHRRARALAKARKAIEDFEAAAAAETAEPTNAVGGLEPGATEQSSAASVAATRGPFRVSTLVHFLLPLALHPLHEAAKSSEAGLLGQAVQLSGAIARHLPWTHYNAALRGLMQQVAGGGGGGKESDSGHSPEKERAMIGAVCQVLDGFHFALIPPGDAEPATSAAAARDPVSNGAGTAAPVGKNAVAAAETAAAAAAAAEGGDAVWRAVNGRLLGSLRALLIKEVRGKSGGKEKVLRAPVALGMLNLIRRLPATAFKLQLQPLLMTVCQSLKSRDSNARDTARDTLAKMTRDLGPDYLQQVVSELRTCLVTGYQLHVRTFTLHTVLKAVADSYSPPNPPSVDVRTIPRCSTPSSSSAPAVAAAADAAAGRIIPAASTVAMDVDGEDRSASAATTGAGDSATTAAKVVPAVPSSLVKPAFDACIPEIVELLMEDLFGESAAAKEAQGANVASSKMKEAKGQKAYDSFEIVARTMLFRPTFTVLAPEDAAAVSSVHALVGPVLSLMEGSENARSVGKANEALTRIGMGLAANRSVTESEMLLYVHATVAPFLLPQTSEEEEEGPEEGNSDDSSDSDTEQRQSTTKKKAKGSAAKGGASSSARKWMASEVNLKGQSRGAAAGEKRRREWESVQVLDGASAPKHTGRDRHDGRAAGRLRPGGASTLTNREGGGARGVDLGDPAALGAVTLALGLLHSSLKAEATARGATKRATAMDRRGEVVRAMADPFVPLLTRCIGKNPHTPVVLLSLKSLGYLLHWNLPSMQRCAPLMGRHVLARLVQGGVGGIRGEMGQACFKALSILFKSQVHVFGISASEEGGSGEGTHGSGGAGAGAGGGGGGEAGGRRRKAGNLFGLSPKQLRALLVVLQMAVAETEHQNATFTLIKAVVSRKVMLPEVYDLMTKLAELAVTSHRPTLRVTAGQTFLTFLLHYPLGEKRLQFHLNQIISGVSYEHAEGRLAAINLCSHLLRRLPEPNLNQLSSVFYLALVVRLVSDPAAECRAAASSAVSTLLTRVSAAVFQELLDFTGQWFGGGGAGAGAPTATEDRGGGAAGGDDPALRRTAAQASGIFVKARPELVRKGGGGGGRRGGGHLPWMLSALSSMLPRRAADVIAAARSAGWGDAAGSVGGSEAGLGTGGGGDGADDWEGVYHAILSIGKAFDALPDACNAALSDRQEERQGYEEDSKKAAPGDEEQLFDRLLEALLYPHAWVRLAAARVWGSFFSKRDPATLAVVGGGVGTAKGGQTPGRTHGSATPTPRKVKGKGRGQQRDVGVAERGGAGGGDGGQEFLRRRRVLFRLCQNFCAQLNRSQVNPKLMEQCVKNLVFIGRAMHLNPELCFAEGDKAAKVDAENEEQEQEQAGDTSDADGMEDAEGQEDDAVATPGDSSSKSNTLIANPPTDDPLKWVFNRMSHMVVHKGEARRRAVFSWFLAMAAVHEPAVSAAHLKLMLVPLRRAVLDAESGGVEHNARGSSAGGGGGAGAGRAADDKQEQTSAELATEVMELLEEKVGSGRFLETLTEVNMEISRKRVERKRQRAVEKATDPVAAAERRRERTEAGKLQKRRKVEESAKLRGGTKRMRMGGIGISGPTSSRGRDGGGGGRGRGGRGGGRFGGRSGGEGRGRGGGRRGGRGRGSRGRR